MSRYEAEMWFTPTELHTRITRTLLLLGLTANHNAVVLMSTAKDERDALVTAGLVVANETHITALTDAGKQLIQRMMDGALDTVIGIGVGSFSQDERLSRVIKVEECDVVDADPGEAEALVKADPQDGGPSPLDAQINDLLGLELGWFEADTPALDKDGLERLRGFLHALLDGTALPRPYLYPTPEAGARAEWSLGGWDVSATFELHSNSAELHAAELDGDGLVEERLPIGDPSAIETLRAFLGRFISQRGT